MRLTNKELYKAIRAGLTVGVIGAVGFTGTAIAQDQDQDQERTLDRIEVTGTRIKRVDVETASPVLQIERAEIEATGLQTVGQLLQGVSAGDNLALSTVANSTNAGDGRQSISLRNLGTLRTLVLVNGRRFATDRFGVTDLSNVPVAIIERIEILKDGASAIYGSDAIAGVVNLITRRDYEGATASAYWGEYDEGDGRLQAYDFTVGASNDRGNITMSAAYVKQEEVMQGDREISRLPIYACATPIAGGQCGSLFPERGFFFVDGIAAPGGLIGGFTTRPDRVIPGLAPGSRTIDDMAPFTNADRYNFAPVNHLLQPSERTTFYTQGNYAVTDAINFSSSLIYTKRKSAREIAEVPLTIDTVGIFGAGPQWSFPISADNVFNPFGADVLAAGYRVTGVGPRTDIQDYDTWGISAGFDGYFELGSRFFQWETAYQHYESAYTSYGSNYINLFNLARGLGPSYLDPGTGTPVCGTPDAPIEGCVPLDLFNGPVGITDAMRDYMAYNLVNEDSSRRDDYLFNISGDLFELPGGMAGFAAGYEYRSDRIQRIPDSLIAAGGSSTNFREATRGGTKVDEFYLELALPLLAGVPFADRLELNIAGRYSDYSGSGQVGSTRVDAGQIGDTTNLKAGFTWKPFEDLLIRGNWAETFRAPTVNDLYAGGGEGFPGADDPCSTDQIGNLTAEGVARCLATGVPTADGIVQTNAQIRGLFGGSPDLRPEFGTTRTLGFVYSPNYLDGFNVSLDWWKIVINDAIGGISVQTALNRCYRQTENPFDTVCNPLIINRGPTGLPVAIRAGNENLSRLELEGYDFNVTYRFDTDFGRFGINLDSTYNTVYKSSVPGQTIINNQVGQLVGATGSASGARYRKRANLALNWNLGDWGASWTMRHMSSLQEACNGFRNGFAQGQFTEQVCSDPNRVVNLPVGSPTGVPGISARNKIGSVTYHDAQVSWNTPFNSSLRLGIRNIGDKDPPYALNAFAGSYLQSYDIPGRFWYVGYTQNF